MAATFESEAARQNNLARLAALEKEYAPNAEVRAAHSTKTFTALIAPFGSGKTVISDEVIRLDPRIQLINTSTTRHRKPEDQPNFRTADEGITTEWFLEKAQNGELTNFSVIPQTDAYGTLSEGFPGDHSIGPFLPSGLEQIKRAGFKRVNPIYIVTPGEMWRGFVDKSRRGLPAQKFTHRALESIDSTEYALSHMDDFIFLKNDIAGAEGITKLARTIVAITLNEVSEKPLSREEATTHLQDMRAVAKDLVGE